MRRVALCLCVLPALVVATAARAREPGGAPPPSAVMPVGWTTSGLSALWTPGRYLVREGDAWVRGPEPGPGIALGAADLSGDVRDEVWMRTSTGGVRIVPYPPGRFAAVDLAGLASAGPVLAIDQDHDGDLDLVAGGVVGGRTGLWTYQNRTPPTTAEAPVMSLVAFDQVGLTTATASPVVGLEAGDVDDGNDLDVVAFARGSAPFLLLSRRQGRFDRESLPGPPVSGPGTLRDLDGDARLDIAYPAGARIAVLIGRGDGTFEPVPPVAVPAAADPLVEVQAADLDGDMRDDLLARDSAGRIHALLAHATGGHRSCALPGNPRTSGTPLVADLDGDGALEVLVPGTGVLWNRSAAGAGSVRVTLRGEGGGVPRRGIGSKVWVSVGARSTRREVRHPAEVFALGGCPHADLIRVQWTNGIRQSELRKEGAGYDGRVVSGSRIEPVQEAGPKQSCPYLYVDRGQGLEYVTDLLAGAPLGLPAPGGGTVPTRPEELVLVPRTAWAAVRGRYRMRITEEFHEITFLDRVRLWVVDHPPGVTVVPDSGMGPGRSEPGLVAFDRVDPPLAATGPAPAPDAAAQDLSLLLAQADGHHFDPPRTGVQGLAPAHAVELTFPRQDPGRRTWLLLEGFVYFSDAGINTRLAQSDPGAMFPPRLEVPDGGERSWRTAVPVVRFPAGRPKTAITEITGRFDPDAPRLRLVTGMRVYLDRVALASVAPGRDPAAGATVRKLAPSRARVMFHGLAPLGPAPDRPPWFIVSAARRRSSLESSLFIPTGMYTRFGPAAPLLAAFDDLYAVIGPGDGVDLEFPAPGGPRSSQVRDLMLDLAGYDKDAHPATFAGERVGPLPYRGMPPYAPSSRFPAGVQRRLAQAHREWSTRPRSGWGGAAHEQRAAILR
jgi:hypothetical protein